MSMQMMRIWHMRMCMLGRLVAVRVQLAGRKAILEVDDSGQGIPPEDLQHIFTPRGPE